MNSRRAHVESPKRSRQAVVALASFAFIACEKPAADEKAAPTPSAENSVATGATNADVSCETLCERSVSCSLELANGNARAFDESDAQATKEATAKRADSLAQCTTTCAKQPPVAEGRAGTCLEKKSCDEFRTCLRETLPVDG